MAAAKKPSANPPAEAPAALAGSTDRKPTRFRLSVPYPYQVKGEDRTGWTEVGVVFPNRNGPGFHGEVRPGVALSGRFVLSPIDEEGRGDDARAPAGG